jgi:hypothetical protein
MDMDLQQFKLYRLRQIRANGPLLSKVSSNIGQLWLSGVMSQYLSSIIMHIIIEYLVKRFMG